jgi:hypothetical protein
MISRRKEFRLGMLSTSSRVWWCDPEFLVVDSPSSDYNIDDIISEKFKSSSVFSRIEIFFASSWRIFIYIYFMCEWSWLFSQNACQVERKQRKLAKEPGIRTSVLDECSCAGDTSCQIFDHAAWVCSSAVRRWSPMLQYENLMSANDRSSCVWSLSCSTREAWIRTYR